MQSGKVETTLNRVPFRPQLTWRSKEKPLHVTGSFLKKYPKYFAQVNFNCKSLKDGRFFSRVKRVKTIHYLALTTKRADYRYRQYRKGSVPKPLMKCILDTKKRSIKDVEIGEGLRQRYSFSKYTGKMVPHIPGIEKYVLESHDPNSWRNFFFMNRIKKLEVVIGSKLKNLDIKQWRFYRHLLLLKQLEVLIIYYDVRRECHDEFYRTLISLNKLSAVLQSLKEFKIITKNTSNKEGLPAIELNMSNTYSSITSIDMMTFHSRLFLDNMSQFTNLMSLETNLYFDRANEKSQFCTEAFFTGLRSLKTLKYLDLKADPNFGSDGVEQIHDFLQNFAVPESVEIINLKLLWFRFYELFPQVDNKTFYMQENNPLEDHQPSREFAEKWKRLINLKSIDISVTNGWHQGYVLNRYLAFLIFSRLPQAEKVHYYQTIYEGGHGGPRPPLDLSLFLRSIEHLFPHLTSISVDDCEVAVKKNFQMPKVDLPRLREFKVGRQILESEFFLNLPRTIIENSHSQEKSIDITIDGLVLQSDEDFGTLLDSLTNIPKPSIINIAVNAWYLKPEKITQYLYNFLENAKPEGSLTLSMTETKLFSKNDTHKLRKQLLTFPVFKQFKIKTRYSENPLFDIKEGVYLKYKIQKPKKKASSKKKKDYDSDANEGYDDLMTYSKI